MRLGAGAGGTPWTLARRRPEPVDELRRHFARDRDLTIPGVFVVRIRDGEIVESRGYFDHVPADRALGRG